MINKNKHFYLAIIVVFFIFLVGNFCSAAFLKDNIKTEIGLQANVGGAAGGYDVYSGGNLLTLSQVVINAFLSLIGVLLLAYLLYGGYYWMTARGEEEKVTKAKDTITRAIIGIIIIIGAYAISVFVISKLEIGTLKSGAPNSAATVKPMP